MRTAIVLEDLTVFYEKKVLSSWPTSPNEPAGEVGFKIDRVEDEKGNKVEITEDQEHEILDELEQLDPKLTDEIISEL